MGVKSVGLRGAGVRGVAKAVTRETELWQSDEVDVFRNADILRGRPVIGRLSVGLGWPLPLLLDEAPPPLDPAEGVVSHLATGFLGNEGRGMDLQYLCFQLGELFHLALIV